MAFCRIGLDPLVDSYRKIGIDKHNMQYMKGKAEKIPFPDEYFDIVSSFNSLDHVDNLDKTINEIIRVLKKGGYFLLLTDVDHDPTICEPISFSWDIVKRFLPRLKLVSEKHYEKFANGMYKSILDDIFYDHSNKVQRYGILSAKFKKL